MCTAILKFAVRGFEPGFYHFNLVQKHILPIEYYSKDYLKAVLSGKKKLLDKSDVRLLNCPRYDEVSVKQLYDIVMEDREVAMYFPDSDQSKKLPERNYFFSVLSTLRTEWLNKVIFEAHMKRNKLQEEESKDDGILVSKEWEELLSKYNFVSSNLFFYFLFIREQRKNYRPSEERIQATE